MKRIAVLSLALLSLAPGLACAESAPAADADPNKVYRDNKQLQVLCQQTAVHIPWDDVEYKGGIDQQGNFIVAADTGMAFSPHEYPIDIPLELDLLEKFHMDVPIGIIADAKVAGIKIYEDGKVQYNGQDITPQVGVFCKEKMIDPALVEKARHEAEAAKEGADIEAEPLAAPAH
mgnify:CR=1 FL=1